MPATHLPPFPGLASQVAELFLWPGQDYPGPLQAAGSLDMMISVSR